MHRPNCYAYPKIAVLPSPVPTEPVGVLVTCTGVGVGVGVTVAVGVGVGVGVTVAVGVGVTVAVGVGVGVGAAQVGLVMWLLSRVTAPLLAKRRPSTVTPVVAVMLTCARTVPRKVELVPSVTELPICQKTLHDCAPLINATLLADAVVRVEPA
jgi:hypothetical protein